MIDYEFVEDVPLTEIKKILIKKKKEGELNFEQKQAYEHAKTFSKISPSQAEKLKNEISENFEISSEVITKIIDILPNKIELDLITEKIKDISEEDKEKLIKIVNKYKKE